MNKDKENILELITNEEVEWKKLGEVLKSITTGLNPRKNFVLNDDSSGELTCWYITTKDYSDTEEIKFIEGKTARITKEAKEKINNRSKLEKGDLLFSAVGTVGKVAIVDIDTSNFDVNESTFVLKCDEKYLNNKYLLYLLREHRFQAQVKSLLKGSTLSGIRKGSLEKIKVPIPSLKLQEKIVYILDKLTLLQSELQSELQARTKQYTYYREHLLSIINLNKLAMKNLLNGEYEIKEYKIKDICNRQKGIDITAKEMKKLDEKDGDIKIFAGGNTYAMTSLENIDSEKVIRVPSIIVKSRGNIEFEYYDKPFTHKNEFWSYSSKDNEKYNIKYVYYCLENNLFKIRNKAITGKLPQISIGVTDDFKITLPPIIIQNIIVQILDKLKSLVDEAQGLLPKEIKQRQKQYEYYLEKLLTFDSQYVKASKQASNNT